MVTVLSTMDTPITKKPNPLAQRNGPHFLSHFLHFAKDTLEHRVISRFRSLNLAVHFIHCHRNMLVPCSSCPNHPKNRTTSQANAKTLDIQTEMPIFALTKREGARVLRI